MFGAEPVAILGQSRGDRGPNKDAHQLPLWLFLGIIFMVEIVFFSWYFPNEKLFFNTWVKFSHLFMMADEPELALAQPPKGEHAFRL